MGRSVGKRVGVEVGDRVGVAVGGAVGVTVGVVVGVAVGAVVGVAVGASDRAEHVHVHAYVEQLLCSSDQMANWAATRSPVAHRESATRHSVVGWPVGVRQSVLLWSAGSVPLQLWATPLNRVSPGATVVASAESAIAVRIARMPVLYTSV